MSGANEDILLSDRERAEGFQRVIWVAAALPRSERAEGFHRLLPEAGTVTASERAEGDHHPLSNAVEPGVDAKLKWSPVVVRRGMAHCPHCETDLTDWAKRLERAPAASSPKVWTCPDCDAILGISDYE